MNENFQTNPIAPTRKRKRNNTSRKYQKWSPEEDALLQQIVLSQQNVNWKETEAHFPGKKAQQIFERWTKVLDPKLMKGSWTVQEDEIITKFVTENGCKSWAKLATLLPGRIGKQCRERWFNHLDPNISRSAWTPDEDRILYKLHEQFGNHWSKISKFMPTRTDNMIKNRWYSVISKKPPPEQQEPTVDPPTIIDSNESAKVTEKENIMPKPFDEANTDYSPSWMAGNATPFQGTPMGSISPMISTGSPFALFSPFSKQTPSFSPWSNEMTPRSMLMSPTLQKSSPPSLSETRMELVNLLVRQ